MGSLDFISAMNRWTAEMKSEPSIAEMDGPAGDNTHVVLPPPQRDNRIPEFVEMGYPLWLGHFYKDVSQSNFQNYPSKKTKFY